MPIHPALRSPRLASPVLGFVLACASLAVVATVAGAATLGYVEKFPGTSLENWGGGSRLSNPGTGGFPEEDDGFLLFETPNGFQHNLGVRTTEAPYLGNWTAAGITQIRLWLNDVGDPNPLEIHVSVGGFANLWQYNPGFVPPNGRWAEFVVDLTNAANWTRVIGTGTFAAALAAVEVVHVRHDKAPFVQNPDPLDGDVGMDQLLLTNGLVGVPHPSPVPRALELAPPAPNPSRGDVTLSLESFEDGPVRVEIVDASGRMVRRFEQAGGAGARSWTWDGRDASGRMAAPGWYRVRATGPSGGMSRALVRIE